MSSDSDRIKNRLSDIFKKQDLHKIKKNQVNPKSDDLIEGVPPFMVFGDESISRREAHEKFQDHITLCMAEGTCVKCGCKYDLGPYPPLGGDTLEGGWVIARQGDYKGVGIFMNICQECYESHASQYGDRLWTQCIGHNRDIPPGGDKSTMYATVTGTHMDDMSIEEREELMARLKNSTDCERVRLEFGKQKDHGAAHNVDRYMDQLVQAARRERRCLYCGDYSPPIPDIDKKGQYHRKWGMVQVAGHAICPICGPCFDESTRYEDDGSREIRPFTFVTQKDPLKDEEEDT